MKRGHNNKVKINPITLIVSFLFLLSVCLRMAQLSLFNTIDGVNLKKLASSRTTKIDVLYATRGTIFDLHGNVLAQNILSYTVIAYLDPKRSENKSKLFHVADKKMTAEKLSPILNMDKDYIEGLLNRQGVNQVELGPGGRGITELTKEKILKLQLPGIDFIESQKRYYPNGRFSSYTIGYAKNNEKNEINGELGLEGLYNKDLKGIDGYLEFQRDRNGFKIPNTKEVRIDSVNGKDIYLTIDSNIQLFVERALKESYDQYNPEWILMVVADAENGKILASSSYPTFDPNIRDLTNYLDPVVSYAFEPGSTMKTFTYMAAMENDKYNGNDTFLSGTIAVGPDTIKDWNTKGWGTITYDLGYALSSNVAVVNLVQKYINGEILRNYFLKLGFGRQTDVGLPKEVPGKITFRYPVEIATAAFGQGITTTPIQNVQALTSISNNGILLKPYIIDKIVDPNTDEIIFQGSRQELGRVANETTVNKIKNLMYDVVHNDISTSTGFQFKVEGLDIITKTGTSQIADGKGGYLTGNSQVIKSFAGMYPKDDPKIIIYAAAKKPRNGSTQSIAIPVKTVAENISKYLNIIPDDSNKEDIKNYKMPSFINKNLTYVEQNLISNKIPLVVLGNGTRVISQYPSSNVNVSCKDKVFIITNDVNKKMPNIIGWSSREVKTLINILNIDYELDGYGFVTRQSIPKDTLITNDSKLIINLKPKFNLDKDT